MGFIGIVFEIGIFVCDLVGGVGGVGVCWDRGGWKWRVVEGLCVVVLDFCDEIVVNFVFVVEW